MATDNQSLTKHLKPHQWQPGQSGNPGGVGGGRRPSLVTALFKELAKEGKSLKSQNDEVAGELVRLALYAKSEDTQLKAIVEIMNRTEGRPRQTIDFSSNEINVTVLAERLVEFAKKAKGVDIPADLAEQLILSSLDRDVDGE